MNVLVTGGNGFLGSYVVAALEQAGHQAFAYDIVAGSAARQRLGQITDQARLFDVCRSDGIDAIVHSAGMVGLEPSLQQPAAFYQTNIMGQVNVCEVARQLAMRRVVFVSSNAVYHPGAGGSLAETNPVVSLKDGNPAGHYGTSKMAAEAIGLAYATFHGLDFRALRVTAIYGHGMRSPMYIKPMVEGAVAGLPVRFETGGPMKRDYTYVLDCADAILRAIEMPLDDPAQRIFNIARGEACTASEVAAVIRRVIPGADIEIGDTLNPLEAANVKMRASLDVTAAARVLGWTPRWSLEDGIKDYADRLRRGGPYA
jgi:nucleoside-diphosphate-sugar epimerase